MSVAVFDFLKWAALYPDLAAKVGRDFATLQFDMAGMYLDNTEGSPVSDVTKRGIYLGLIVAHLCALSPQGGASGLVGRVTNASEGSVSVAADYGTQSASAAFWLQTPYGAQYWQMTGWLRRFRYVAAPPSPAEAPAGFYLTPGRRAPW